MRGHLSNIADFAFNRQVRHKLVEEGVLALTFQRRLKLNMMVEIVLPSRFYRDR